MSAASTRAVLDHHLAALVAGDVDGLMDDYTDDSVLISNLGGGVLKGFDEIRAMFAAGADMTGWERLVTHVEHEVAAATAVATRALAVRTGHSARDVFSVYVGHHSLPCSQLLNRPISLPAAGIIPNSEVSRSRAQAARAQPAASYSCVRRVRSRSSTSSGTNPLTSPPYLAISLIRLEDRNEYSGLVVMNSVSTLARR